MEWELPKTMYLPDGCRMSFWDADGSEIECTPIMAIRDKDNNVIARVNPDAPFWEVPKAEKQQYVEGEFDFAGSFGWIPIRLGPMEAAEARRLVAAKCTYDFWRNIRIVEADA